MKDDRRRNTLVAPDINGFGIRFRIGDIVKINIPKSVSLFGSSMDRARYCLEYGIDKEVLKCAGKIGKVVDYYKFPIGVNTSRDVGVKVKIKDHIVPLVINQGLLKLWSNIDKSVICGKEVKFKIGEKVIIDIPQDLIEGKSKYKVPLDDNLKEIDYEPFCIIYGINKDTTTKYAGKTGKVVGYFENLLIGELKTTKDVGIRLEIDGELVYHYWNQKLLRSVDMKDSNDYSCSWKFGTDLIIEEVVEEIKNLEIINKSKYNVGDVVKIDIPFSERNFIPEYFVFRFSYATVTDVIVDEEGSLLYKLNIDFGINNWPELYLDSDDHCDEIRVYRNNLICFPGDKVKYDEENDLYIVVDVSYLSRNDGDIMYELRPVYSFFEKYYIDFFVNSGYSKIKDTYAIKRRHKLCPCNIVYQYSPGDKVIVSIPDRPEDKRIMEIVKPYYGPPYPKYHVKDEQDMMVVSEDDIINNEQYDSDFDNFCNNYCKMACDLIYSKCPFKVYKRKCTK